MQHICTRFCLRNYFKYLTRKLTSALTLKDLVNNNNNNNRLFCVCVFFLYSNQNSCLKPHLSIYIVLTRPYGVYLCLLFIGERSVDSDWE